MVSEPALAGWGISLFAFESYPDYEPILPIAEGGLDDKRAHTCNTFVSIESHPPPFPLWDSLPALPCWNSLAMRAPTLAMFFRSPDMPDMLTLIEVKWE